MTTALRIVVADDEADMRDYFCKILPRLGHNVVAAAATGNQLVDLCARHSPDLAISDIKMPELDGLQAAEKIAGTQGIPTILVSAYLTSVPPPEHILQYLIKPIKQAELRTALDLATRWVSQFRIIKEEAESLAQAKEDQRAIHGAKAIIIKEAGLDDESAFTRLRDLARERNMKLAELAQQVLTSGDGLFT